MASEPDPVIPYQQGEVGNIARLRALPGSKMFQAWESAVTDIPSTRDYTSLWCEDPDSKTDGSDRLDQAGTFYFACAATTSVANGTTLGMLELEYDIEFFVPRLNASALTRSAELGFDGDAWNAIFDIAFAVPILNKIFTFLKTYTGPLSQVLSSVLRLYTDINQSSVTRTSSSADIWTGGMPSGHHSITITMCYNSTPSFAPATTSLLDSNIAYSSGFGSGASGAFDVLLNYKANDGNVYDAAYQVNCDYGVSGAMRGYVDFMYDTTSVTTPDYVEFIYRSAGSESLQTIVTSDLISRRISRADAERRAKTAVTKRKDQDGKESKEKRATAAPAKAAVEPDLAPPVAAPPSARVRSSTPPPSTRVGDGFTLVRSPRQSTGHLPSLTSVTIHR
jgi:hypothetical protein